MTLNETNAPTLFGLVLAGGKSVRMGEDKTQIAWHSKPHKYYMADVLAAYCHKVYLSCREEQTKTINTAYNPLPDCIADHGPLGGIYTALTKHPQVAWLVVACDLPLLADNTTLPYLIAQRDIHKIATAYLSPHDSMPEPLIAIWEPASITAVNQYIQQGYKCPRKVLINSNIHTITPPNPQSLMNVNTPS